MTTLFFLKIDQAINSVLFNKFMSLVTLEKQQHVKAFKFDIDKKLSLYSELILRHAICEKWNIKNSEMIFYKNTYDKPFLKNYPQIQFNISHTINALGVAISNKPIGIDIEKVKKEDYELKIANKFFTNNEYRFIEKSKNNTYRRFYEIWTKKESYPRLKL